MFGYGGATERSGFPLRWKSPVEPGESPGSLKHSQGRRIAYFINVFPYLTETFIYREVKALRDLGADILTFAIRRPDPQALSEEARGLVHNTYYLLPVSLGPLFLAHAKLFWRGPRQYLRILYDVVTGTHMCVTDRLRSLCHFVEAVGVLPVVEQLEISHLHAHYAVGAATCTWVLARFLRLDFSLTAHAYDIWLDQLLLPEKLQAATFVVTCTAANKQHLVQTYRIPPDKIHVVYHGVDVQQFAPRRHAKTTVPLRLLAVGRLVEQKGFDHLLQACVILRQQGYPFRCEIVGDGPLADSLHRLSTQLGLGACVRFVGRVFQEEIVEYFAAAALFVLPCIPASNHDRDGIPNTLMEAMACGLPVFVFGDPRASC
jgi:colanic acid/amylovoran biosynthesis glycosyltransferase